MLRANTIRTLLSEAVRAGQYVRDIPLQAVLKQLEEVDCTGDPEWVGGLQDDARKFPDWVEAWVPLHHVDIQCCDTDTAEYYASMGGRMPAIVAIPAGPKSKTLSVLDGGHRSLACHLMGADSILAYIPRQAAVNLGILPKTAPTRNVAEAAGEQYTEVEFLCVNSAYDTGLDPAKQEALFKDLRKVKGLVVYRQDMDGSSPEDIQVAMAAIIKDRDREPQLMKTIKALAAKHGVPIDLTDYVTSDYLARAESGRLQYQISESAGAGQEQFNPHEDHVVFEKDGIRYAVDSLGLPGNSAAFDSSGKKVGYLVCRGDEVLIDGEAYIPVHSVEVDPNLRTKGIGTLLYVALLYALGRVNGHDKGLFSATKDIVSDHVLRIHSKLGFSDAVTDDGVDGEIAGPISAAGLKPFGVTLPKITGKARPIKEALGDDAFDAVTKTDKFQKWFKNSKVVDSGGKPLVVSHGFAGRNFRKFSLGQLGQNFPNAVSKQGLFFTADDGVSQTFALCAADDRRAVGKADTRRVHYAFLSLQNPLEIDARRISGSSDQGVKKLANLIARGKSDGHDGAIIHGWRDGSNAKVQYVAFHPDQVWIVHTAKLDENASKSAIQAGGECLAKLRRAYQSILQTALEYAADPDVYLAYLKKRPGLGGTGAKGYDPKLESFCDLVAANIFYWLYDQGCEPGTELLLVRGKVPGSVCVDRGQHSWIEVQDGGQWWVVDGAAGQFGPTEKRLRILGKAGAAQYRKGKPDLAWMEDAV